MSESRRQLLSIGVFLIIVVVAILLAATGLIGNWLNFFPTVFILFGIWLLVLATMRAQAPMKYERSPFGTVEMGVLLMALGGAWLLFRTGWYYSIALLLLALGVIAIVASMRRKTP
jgi:hypothetical protein